MLSPFEGMTEVSSDVTRVLRSLIESLGPVRVIEIGTAYGRHLPLLRGLDFEMVSIDPMYDWVPDIQPDVPFDSALVDERKVAEWNACAADVPVTLIISKSWDAAQTLSGSFDVLLIDGCHHPQLAVEQDYTSFSHLMRDDHWVIFDDINHGDPGNASLKISEDLRASGHAVGSDDYFGGHIRVLHITKQV